MADTKKETGKSDLLSEPTHLAKRNLLGLSMLLIAMKASAASFNTLDILGIKGFDKNLAALIIVIMIGYFGLSFAMYAAMDVINRQKLPFEIKEDEDLDKEIDIRIMKILEKINTEINSVTYIKYNYDYIVYKFKNHTDKNADLGISFYFASTEDIFRISTQIDKTSDAMQLWEKYATNRLNDVEAEVRQAIKDAKNKKKTSKTKRYTSIVRTYFWDIAIPFIIACYAIVNAYSASPIISTERRTPKMTAVPQAQPLTVQGAPVVPQVQPSAAQGAQPSPLPRPQP